MSSSDPVMEDAAIAEAIAVQQRILEITSDGHADLPPWLVDLSISVNERLIAAHIIPEGPRQYPTWLNNLSISVFQRVVNFAPGGVPSWLNNLSTSLHSHFLPALLKDLGIALQARFERTGDLADIADSISVLRRAVQLTPRGHTELPSRLSELGNSFESRFKRTGDLTDISEAILAQQQAVLFTPEGDRALPGWLTNLGISLLSRYERTGELADVAEAISVKQRAVQLIPEGHVLLSALLNNLGMSLRIRFDRIGTVADIEEAISVQRRSVRLTPDGHLDLPARLTNLGISLRSLSELTGDVDKLEEGITAQQRAIRLTPKGHADLPLHLNYLGTSLESRFARTADAADIEEAVVTHRKAVDLTPAGHAAIPARLYDLGNAIYKRSEKTGSSEDLNTSVFHFSSAATRDFGAPQDRFKAARRWARMLNVHNPLSSDVVLAFDTAIHLLTLVAGLEQTVKGRYTQLQEASGIALEGAAAACRLQRPDKGVEWLEQGRCLVWNQLTSLRTPLDDLQAHDSQLAQRLTHVSKGLEKAASSRNSLDPSMNIAAKISVQHEARSHLDLSNEWNTLLSTVRSIAGFESFLLPSRCSTLMRNLPQSGAVVIINVNQDRCDAIALLAGTEAPLHIPLPNFSLVKADKYRQALNDQLQYKGIRMRDTEMGVDDGSSERALKRFRKGGVDGSAVRNVLRGLWIEVVKPVLDLLRYSRSDPASSDGVLPRIWWCPTGVMSFLPIHAAGLYTNGESESILDYAVSSYTPTLTALSDRVNQCRQDRTLGSGLFLTSQPSAPGAASIPGTTKEIERVYTSALENGVKSSKAVGSDISVQDCLRYMGEFSSVHLACHASQNAADPLQSRFLLHAGELTLGTIIQMNLKSADLAFLSACQTSTGEEKLSDEAVHLAAGMLAAGYRRVVATMWSIKDQHAPDVASDFYEYLWSRREGGSGEGFDGSLSAYGLHHAIRRLRDRVGNSEDSLLTWIPYVHFGY